MQSNQQPSILVVDDQPINIKLLERRLQREDMHVITAVNGRECVEKVKQSYPDLILLDVMMPEMDGIEACQILKADPDTKDIPIIFITARTSQEGKIEGLKIGAADYITKPIDLEETMARVYTQLRIRQAHKENLELQQRLNDVRRSAAIGSITQGISHNLNNLLGVVVGYIDLLKQSKGNEAMTERAVNSMDKAIQRMVKLIRELSRVASEEQIPITTCNLASLLKTSLNRYKVESNRDTPITVENPMEESFTFRTNPEVFESILSKLLVNSAEAVEAAKREPEIKLIVKKKAASGKEFIAFTIRDNGTGISNKIEETIFEPFVSTQTAVGRGLGLTLVRHAVHNLKGDLSFKSRDGEGTDFTVQFPLDS